jgi:hypothetical protein
MLPSFIKNMTIVALSFVPSSLASIPYFLTLSFIKSIVPMRSKCWHRNSLYFGNISLGISDIDLSIIYKSESDAKLFYNRLKRIKYIFPYIGEVNSYSESNLDLVQKMINPYELERDPELKKIMAERSKSDQALIVFLCRMLKSDLHGLKNYPLARKRKWKFHFNFVNAETLPSMSFENILKTILAKIKINSEQKKIIENFFNTESQEDLNQLYSESKNKKDYMTLFTIEWIGLAIANHSFHEDLKLVNSCDNDDLSLMIENLKWELFGLYSQYLYIGSDKASDIKYHLGLLSIINQELKSDEIKKVIEELNRLI